jgi:hypothetical protein
MTTIGLEGLRISTFFKTHFGSRAVAVTCILLAILNKALIAAIHTDLEGDKALYLLFAQSMLNGTAPVEPIGSLPNGLQAYSFNPGIFQPLYSLLALPFLWLTKSPFWTSVAVDVMAWALFFTGLYKFSLVILRERWTASILVLCTGLFIYPHELESAPKDTLAVALIIWCVYFTWQFISRHYSIAKTIRLGICFLLLCTTKFLYAPLVALFLAIIFFTVIKRKERKGFYHFIALSLLCVLAYGGLYLYVLHLMNLPWLMSQRISNVREFTPGFFPENLLQIFPFITSSLINTNFWGVQLEDIFNTGFGKIISAFQILDLVLLPVLLYFFHKMILQQGDEQKKLIRISLASALAIIFIICFMSVRNKAITYSVGSNPWTYVKDTRSYLFVLLFLQVTLFYFIFSWKTAPLTLRNFLFLLFIIECMHGGYFTLKQVMTASSVQQRISTQSAVKKVTNLLVDAKQKLGSPVSLVTQDIHLRRYAILKNVTVLKFEPQWCNFLQGETRNPVLLITYQTDSATLQCDSSRLITEDAVPPFRLRLYSAGK